MTCPSCGSPRVERIERWATRCLDCHHVTLTRRSFLVGLGAAMGLAAVPTVLMPREDWSGSVAILPIVPEDFTYWVNMKASDYRAVEYGRGLLDAVRATQAEIVRINGMHGNPLILTGRRAR